MAKETDKTAVKNQSHPEGQSFEGDDVDDKDASRKKKETREIIVDVSELETFWRSYIA
ncbi:MAG: hypothetical protein ACFFEA_07580 [Candidatus Thorarchaeota archaeon]